MLITLAVQSTYEMSKSNSSKKPLIKYAYSSSYSPAIISTNKLQNQPKKAQLKLLIAIQKVHKAMPKTPYLMDETLSMFVTYSDF